MRRGYTYTTSFTLKQKPSNAPVNLTGSTIKLIIGSLEFDVTADSPPTAGIVSVVLSPAQTATIPKGTLTAFLKVTIGSTVKPYGVHRISVI